MPDDTSPAKPASFEDSLAELQRIVADLEEGRVGLEESLAKFERGISLLKACHQTLERTEQRIEILVGMKSDGTPITEPFDANATLNAESPSPSAGRRKPRKAKTEVSPAPEATGSTEEDEDSGFLF